MSYTDDEIRINSRYTQHLRSVFEDGSDGDSVPTIRKKVTTTQEYLKKLTDGFGVFNGVLPPNCRYYEKVSNGTLVVIEEPPAYHTISVDYPMSREIAVLKESNKIEEWGIDEEFYKDSKNKPFKFNLAFPYVIHLLMFDKYNILSAGQVFLRNARLSGLSDYLLKMPMMNISSEGYICYGDKAHIRNKSLTSGIENTVMVFWSAIFNSDYTYNYTAYKNIAGVNTYIGWQALSRIDPLFIYNVEWIKEERNLSQEIARIKGNHDSENSSIKYESLSKVFTQPSDTGIEEKIRRNSATSTRTSKLYYDIAQGIYLDEQFFFHVNDPIIWGNHTAHVDSFIGFFESDEIRLIRLQLDNDKFIHIRLTSKVKRYLLEKAKEIRFSQEGTLKNGTIVKPENIIKIAGIDKEIFRKIYYIRKARDGITEAKIGDMFYILENTEGEVVNIDSPKYDGIDINKEDEYIMTLGSTYGPCLEGRKVKFDGVNVSSNGKLSLDFISENKSRIRPDRYSLNLDSTEEETSRTRRRIYKSSDCKVLPKIFRVGRRLVCMKSNLEICENQAWTIPDGVVYNTGYTFSTPTIEEIEKNLISEDGSTFHIDSNDLDITFSIGDKVVYSDWENPINMLIIRTITAFKIDKENSTLDFILSDKNGNLSQVNYITKHSTRSSVNGCTTINIGRIRKITNVFKRTTAGTKIIAEKGYIPHFPKKDVNIIIGFITDTGGDDPLVLCSNCCTLWYSDMMENFKRVTMKSKQWVNLPHSPVDITKIKFQAGDIVNGGVEFNSTSGWLIVHNEGYKSLRMANLDNYIGGMDMYNLDTYSRNRVKLDCIPLPRISSSDQNKMSTTYAWPNFHGLFIENKISRLQFLEDERSMLHVSDPH